MKKKLMALLLTLTMVATLFAGCGGGGGEEASGGADVAVFYYTYSDTYIASVRTALDAALEAAGVNYMDYDSAGDQTKQNEQIDTAIANGAKCLVVNLVSTGADDVSIAIAEKAKAAGIPVIFFNRAIEANEGDVLNKYDHISFVGTDAPEAGHMQGKMIGDYVVANYDALDLNGDGKISYAMFKGQMGNVEADARTQFGVEDADAILTAAGKPALEYFDAANTDKYQVDLTGNWSSAAALEYMNTNLSQYNIENNNMIELVICNNDGMAEGVISSLEKIGYNTGDAAKTIPVFGVDATDAAKDLIAKGKMTGTIKQDAEGMANCICALAKNVVDGADMLANTDSYNKAPGFDNKIYIPYATYTGQ